MTLSGYKTKVSKWEKYYFLNQFKLVIEGLGTHLTQSLAQVFLQSTETIKQILTMIVRKCDKAEICTLPWHA